MVGDALHLSEEVPHLLQVGRAAPRRREREVRCFELFNEVLREEPGDDFFKVYVLRPQVAMKHAHLQKGVDVRGPERDTEVVVGLPSEPDVTFEHTQVCWVGGQCEQASAVSEPEEMLEVVENAWVIIRVVQPAAAERELGDHPIELDADRFVLGVGDAQLTAGSHPGVVLEELLGHALLAPLRL